MNISTTLPSKTIFWIGSTCIPLVLSGCVAESMDADNNAEISEPQPEETVAAQVTHALLTLPPCLINPFCTAPSNTPYVIIAPDAFRPALAPLVEHKNNRGIPTYMVSLERVVFAYHGADDAEKVKKAIAFAEENLHTRYVMLVGNARMFPVRHRAVTQPRRTPPGECRPWLDATYNPSELYYSNLHHHDMREYCEVPGGETKVAIYNVGFDNWDSDGDGKYNEEMWGSDTIVYNPDHVDGFPDLAVGRLPAGTSTDVSTYVHKVIAYETGEGTHQVSCEFAFFAYYGYLNSDSLSDGIAANLAPGTKIHKVMLDGPSSLPGWSTAWPDDIHLASAFCGWVSYVGHGDRAGWTGGNFKIQNASSLGNPMNFPVVVGVACDTGTITSNAPVGGPYFGVDNQVHNISKADGCPSTAYDQAQGTTINLPMTVVPPSNYDEAYPANTPTFPGAWLFNPDGGAIAYFGETLVQSNDPGAELEGYMLSRWNDGERTLGDIWLGAQRDYWFQNINSGGIFTAPRIQLGIMTFYGDPTLQLPE